MKIASLMLVLALISCNGNKGNSSDVATDSPVVKNETSDTIASPPVITETTDSVIQIRFPKDSTQTTVRGEMKGIGRPVTVYIPVKQGRQLTATLQPDDPNANIRINQVFTPDGKADGPFGRELKRTINQQGTYKIILGENQMQGDEWKGKFALTIKVE